VEEECTHIPQPILSDDDWSGNGMGEKKGKKGSGAAAPNLSWEEPFT